MILTKHLPKDKYPAKGRTELEPCFLLLRSNQFSPSKIILSFHITKRTIGIIIQMLDKPTASQPVGTDAFRFPSSPQMLEEENGRGG